MDMINYHPDARFLTDYAAGSLPLSQALCVASHLHYCVACRSKNRELEELGAELFMQQQAAPVTVAEFARVLARIGAGDTAAPATPVASGTVVPLLPRAVSKLAKGNLDQLPWRSIGRNFRYTPLAVGDATRETSLLVIKAGGSVPRHRHAGDEITVILKGSFSDNEGKYCVGDFVVRTKGETHQPVASQDQDCLCLATEDAPIVMSNWLLRLAMVFLQPRKRRVHKAA